MNAKDRANFINKIGIGAQETASGEKICSQCGAVVKGKFCSRCGTPYTSSETDEKPVPAEAAAEPVPAAKENSEAAAKPMPKQGSPFGAVKETETQDTALAEAAEDNTDTAAGNKKASQAANPFAAVKNTIQTGINKVGDQKYCLNCGAAVKGKFCMKCGTPVDGSVLRTASESAEAAPNVVKKKKVQPYVAPPRRPAPTGGHKTGMFSAVQETNDEQEDSVFAKGLPEWSLEPPHTPVKRKTSKLL